MAGEQMTPAPEGGEGGGGGITQFLQELDAGLLKVNQALSQSEQAPPEAKAAFQAAHEAFRQGLEILTGGGEAPQQGPSQTTTPEQGASGAQPMSHGRPA